MSSRNFLAASMAFYAVQSGGVEAANLSTPGYYSQLYYVTAISVAGSGSCIDSVNTYFTQQLYYPGPSKAGATEWRAISLPGVLENEVVALPATPKLNATKWSGKYKATFLPGGTPATVSFSVAFTKTDAFSSLGTGTDVYETAAGGTCTETYQFNNIFTGH